MPIISGKVGNARIEVLMQVQKACEYAAAHNGDYYLGPINKALTTLIEEVRKEEQGR